MGTGSKSFASGSLREASVDQSPFHHWFLTWEFWIWGETAPYIAFWFRAYGAFWKALHQPDQISMPSWILESLKDHSAVLSSQLLQDTVASEIQLEFQWLPWWIRYCTSSTVQWEPGSEAMSGIPWQWPRHSVCPGVVVSATARCRVSKCVFRVPSRKSENANPPWRQDLTSSACHREAGGHSCKGAPVGGLGSW